MTSSNESHRIFDIWETLFFLYHIPGHESHFISSSVELILTKGSCAERGLNKPSQVSLVNQAHVFTFFFFLMRHKEARIKHRMVFIYVFQIYIFCFYKAPHPHAFHIQQKQHSELEIKDGNCFYSEITFGHFLKRENIKMQVAYRITSEITSPL